MSRFSKTLIALLLAGAATSAAAWDRYPGIGREATPAEVKAWDIDVRPDFAGLPKGRGNVDDGIELWETHCTSCHGSFGESNEVFTPIVGGTSADDIKTGHVKSLISGSSPQRTTLMKVATVSTLFDYIQRRGRERHNLDATAIDRDIRVIMGVFDGTLTIKLVHRPK